MTPLCDDAKGFTEDFAEGTGDMVPPIRPNEELSADTDAYVHEVSADIKYYKSGEEEGDDGGSSYGGGRGVHGHDDGVLPHIGGG